ncbi:hypothetical protein F8A87_06005 [Betaproteobacteria bacterium SCN2]|nr:hypothetical protein F8A87_06005 [Betaproteobacteria bacterium SCN2]
MTDDEMQRLVEFAQIVSAARDAMSDDIVSRLAGAMSEGMTLLDRLTRNQGLMSLLQVLDREDSQNFLVALSKAIHEASQEIAATPPAAGGIGCAVRVVRDPGTLEGLRLLSLIGKHMSNSLREQHRHPG